MTSPSTFPHYTDKHRSPPLFTALDFHRYVARRTGELPPRVPSGIVLVFGRRWERYLRRRFGGMRDRRTGVYRANATVGVSEVGGPGAPHLAIEVEELAALGARRFVIVGLAGSLQSRVPAGAFVVCSKALRDEGTSHHYRRPEPFARPSARLTAKLRSELRKEAVTFFEGPSWTIDAPYRETVAEVRHYRRAGILTVEMEAAALFTVVRHLGGGAAALFVISDHLDEKGWQPQFHRTPGALRRGLEIAIAAARG